MLGWWDAAKFCEAEGEFCVREIVESPSHCPGASKLRCDMEVKTKSTDERGGESFVSGENARKHCGVE